jgi:hypothetical protein
MSFDAWFWLVAVIISWPACLWQLQALLAMPMVWPFHASNRARTASGNTSTGCDPGSGAPSGPWRDVG